MDIIRITVIMQYVHINATQDMLKLWYGYVFAALNISQTIMYPRGCGERIS